MAKQNTMIAGEQSLRSAELLHYKNKAQRVAVPCLKSRLQASLLP